MNKNLTRKNFAINPQAHINRSTFPRWSDLKTTFNASRLVPVYIDEVVPGDTHSMNCKAFGRIAEAIRKPNMDRIHVDVHFFFVPTRLVWDNWQKFMGERKNPADSIDYTIPTYRLATNYTPAQLAHSIWDALALPINSTTSAQIRVNALPFRAYWLIYNEWYRDQNLINSITIDTSDTNATLDLDDITPLRRAKRHDYFTSCLPYAQKGDPVILPLGDEAPVYFPTVPRTLPFNSDTVIRPKANSILRTFEADTDGRTVMLNDGVTSGEQIDVNLNLPALTLQMGNPYADLTAATATTINSIREAFALQRMLEKDARGGTRYIEIIRTHFGVTSPDSRLQRPEFIGGLSTQANYNVVAQTSSSDTTSPQGSLASFGTYYASGHAFTQSFTEHGYIIGIASVWPDVTYQQGLDRLWSRQTRLDFMWPSLAHLGEQPVYSKEIYCDGTVQDDAVFGYQERYAEYRYKPSRITGLFRSVQPQSLDVYHLSEYFTTRPQLNQLFIGVSDVIKRITLGDGTSTQIPDILAQFEFDLKSTRPLPVYGIPGMIDHF